mgnify:CR=1 FL=1
MNDLMTRKQTAIKLQIGVRSVDRLIKAGLLKATYIGTLVRISENALSDYIWGATKKGKIV